MVVNFLEGFDMHGSATIAVSVLLVLSRLLLQPACLRADAIQLSIRSGQELADAVVAWGQAGDDRVLVLEVPLINLQNATWRDPHTYPNATGSPSQPFSAGQLTIRSATDTNRSIINTANRWGLIPYMQRQAQITLNSVILVNLCLTSFPLSFSPPMMLTSGFTTRLFVTAPEYQSETVINTTYYGSQWDIAQHEYFTIVARSRFPPIHAATLPVFGDMSDAQTVISRITPFSVQASASHTSLLMKDVEFASLSRPDDPVLHFLNQSGVILDTQYCNGTRLVQGMDQDIIDLQGVPMWLVGDVPALEHSLGHVANMSQCVLPPAIMVVGNITLTAQDSHTASGARSSWPVSCMLQLSGAFLDTPSTQQPSMLDLNGRQSVFHLQSGGQLFIQQMILQGLQPQPISTGLQSIFPLAAVNISGSRPSAPIWFNNMTLVMPVSDYMAFAALAASSTNGFINSAAASGCLDAPTAQLAMYLASNITQITASDAFNVFVPSMLHLDMLQGWGINATSIRVIPEQPLPAHATLAACIPVSTDSSRGESTGHSEHPKTAGLAVGIGVGVPLLLSLSGIALLLVQRHRRHSQLAACQSSNPASKSGPDTSATSTKLPKGTGHSSGSLSQAPRTNSSSSTNSNPTSQHTARLHATQTVKHEMTTQGNMALFNTQNGNPMMLTTTATGFELIGEDRVGSTNGSTMSFLASPNQRQFLDIETGAVGAAEGPEAGAHKLDAGCTPCSKAASMSGTQQHLAHRDADHTAVTNRPAANQTWTNRNLMAGTRSTMQAGLATSPQHAGTASSPLQTAAATSPAQDGTATPPVHRRIADHSTSAEPSSQSDGSIIQQAGAAASVSCSLSVWRPRSEVKQLSGTLTEEGVADRLTVLGMLGQGASGTVFIGEWRGLRVALKTVVFPAGHAAAQRAVMETAIAASVGHRNVVATYHYDFKPIISKQDTHEGELQVKEAPTACLDEPRDVKLFLVQELCAASLTEALDNFVLHDAVTGAPDLRAILSVLLDIAQGLAYLHHHSIIHGDLKPSNVLLKQDLSAPPLQVVAKLADFGVSVYLGGIRTHVSCYMGGSPWYTAPEVVEHKRASPASDTYSLGVIMWQLYTGRTPGAGSNDPAAVTTGHDDTATAGDVNAGSMPRLEAAVKGPAAEHPTFPNFSGPHMPPFLYMQLMQWCLQQDPKQRPTAMQAAQCLHAIATSTCN